MTLLRALLWLAIITAFILASICYAVYVWRSVFPTANKARRRKVLQQLGIQNDDRVLAGLFHPYCNAGGGGERVLWTAVACLQREEPKVICIVYTGDIGASKEEIVFKVKDRFSIELDPSRLHFVYLKKRYLVEDSTWKHFTLIGQSLGSVVLGFEAIRKLSPDVFIDTMGYAFTFPLVKVLARVPVGAYVHYPTISTNMLQRVKDRAAGHTNTSAVSRSSILSNAKLLYYIIFARLYSFCLRQADYIMVNSSWTQGHVNTLLKADTKTANIVYPPCDTKSLSSLALDGREKIILSLAQFRPEKEHATQLRFYKAFTDLVGVQEASQWKLIMAGSVRNAGDEARVKELQKLASELGTSDHMEFVINAPFPELRDLLAKASVGLSTMVDEHFGINVVEFMSAGLIPLVHASGGPLLDIVTPIDGKVTGYHARDPADFAIQMRSIAQLTEAEALSIRQCARQAAEERFSEKGFDEGWMKAWRSLV